MEPSAWTCVSAALSLKAEGDGDDVKLGGHSLRCCVQPLVLKLNTIREENFIIMQKIRAFVLNIP